MVDITFSAMNYGSQTENVLLPLLKEYEQQSKNHVNLYLMDWTTGRQELNQIVFRHQGPDVSEIGQTWLSDIISMNALRPFNAFDLARIGRKEAFFPASWINCTVPDDPTVWAIPWLTDIFLIHYRKDLLQKAGIDEAKAFETFTEIDHTVERLKQSGVEIPVSMPLNTDTYSNLHCIASWVWGFGGDFFSPDGKEILFDQPQAVQGIAAYYKLLRHLSPTALSRCHSQAGAELFNAGQAAICFAPQGARPQGSEMEPETSANWGMASFPRGSLIAGSNLVIWKHTRQERAAVELASFLTNTWFQSRFALPLGVLPCRVEAFSQPPFTEDPLLKKLTQIITISRCYQTIPLWGIVEDRLSQAMAMIWEEFYANPAVDLEVITQKHIQATATRLRSFLAQYHSP